MICQRSMASTVSGVERHVGLFRRIHNDSAVRVSADRPVRVLLAGPTDGGADDTQGPVGSGLAVQLKEAAILETGQRRTLAFWPSSLAMLAGLDAGFDRPLDQAFEVIAFDPDQRMSKWAVLLPPIDIDIKLQPRRVAWSH